MIRPTDLLIAAALTGAMSGAALAQTPATHTITGDTDDSWVASGFVGTNFGTSTDNLDLDGGASLDFGGQLAYIWNGVLGGEIIADFAPNVGDNLLFANEPEVNSYMANVITAVPLSAGNFQPYVSGGFGAIQIRSDLFDLFGNTFSSNHTRFGGNIGGGVMAFAEHVGIRADIRYYRATSDNNLDDLVFEDDVIPRTFLSGLGFWRGNVGLAIRW